MNFFEHIRDQILELLSLYPKDSLQKITVEPPRDASHGDISTNAAMVLSKLANKNPRELASDFQKLFQQIKYVENITIAGPGFINFSLKKDFLQMQVGVINRAGTEYGYSSIGAGQKVNVEYVSVNPTGPLHIGHARGSVFGDVLASLLEKTGFEVTREYYFNDAGGQVDTLAKSALLRYQGATEIPAGMYPGEYLIPVAAAMHQELGDNLAEKDLPEISKFVIKEMLKLIRANLAAANITHDVFISEAEVTNDGYVEEALKVLSEKGYIYQGVLEAPKGKKLDDWEEREQTLFKSTEFGDDVDRAIKKSNGSFTYFAGDLGYHLHKIRRGYSKLVNVLGADHTGYAKRLKAGVTALSDGKVELEVKLCALVKLLQNGESVKMSKRGGNYVFMEEVIEEVGIDALRFIMLTRKNDIPLDFDLAKVVEQNKDNPVFYVQYAHARCYSAMRQATAILSPLPKGGKLSINPLPEGGVGGGFTSRPGNPELVPNVKELRKNPTEPEKILWNALKNSQLDGHKFRRQEAIGNYVVDFICYEKNLVIEIDGDSHALNLNYDEKRTEVLQKHGLKVLRFWNNEVMENKEGVLAKIVSSLREEVGGGLGDNLSNQSQTLTPSLSLREREAADLSLLTTEPELAMIKKLIEYPRMLEAAATSYEPHRIAFYLEQLAAEFHSLWNLGNNDKSLRFIAPDKNLTIARLALVKAVANVIASGLQIMGVSAPEEMK